ncbi:25S rRNA (adenine2142-N1)-methyltransferase, partial [Goodea atripinnis]
GDFDKIWREHCEDEQTLSEYALAMKNLADNHWTKKCEGEGRIEWCRSDRGPLATRLSAAKSGTLGAPSDAVEAFLRHLHNPIDALPGQLFHVVVFSLLLSYFPSPYQRWICCKKAHELLDLHGLLLIITPDSSHQNRHALMMRSWRVAVESLGFKRYKYVKYSHMHLIAFRKVSVATTSDLVSRNYPEMLYIPQDFNSNEEEDCTNAPPQGLRSEFEDDQLAWGFTELPDTPYDSDSGESQSSSVPGFHELEDPILLQS